MKNLGAFFLFLGLCGPALAGSGPTFSSGQAAANLNWNGTLNLYQVPQLDAATGYAGVVCESGCTGGGGGTVTQGPQGSASSPWFFTFGTGATLPPFASVPTFNIGTAPAIALGSGSSTVGKIDILGNAGAAIDGAPGAAPPTNGLQDVCPFVTVPTERATATTSAVNCNQYGAQFVDTESIKPSFLTSFTLIPPASGIFLTVCGPTTGATRVRWINIQALASTNAGTTDIILSKYSAAPTGGTSTAQTNVAQDASNTIVDTATVNAYTVAPSGGTSLGQIAEQVSSVPLSTSPGIPMLWNFGAPTDTQALVLRGAAQCAVFSSTITTAATASYKITIARTTE